MRQLKFRAWDKLEGKMLTVTGLEPYNCNSYRYSKSYAPDCIKAGARDNRVIIMQFTGLLEKNGVEVYEGDVFSHVCAECEAIGCENCSDAEHTSAVVFWSDQLQAFLWHPINEDEGMSTLLPDSDEIEVIGNIHENPVLLEKP